jgi:hypothetical protein
MLANLYRLEVAYEISLSLSGNRTYIEVAFVNLIAQVDPGSLLLSGWGQKSSECEPEAK